jgi:nitrogenase-stabilizing/protective protein
MSGFAEDVGRLSSAEDFLGYLAVAYDPAVVAVNRLHILKRFHDYLARIDDAACAGEAEKRAAWRDALSRAYRDFVVSTPLEQKVFPVFRMAQAGFVALSSVKPLTGT